PSPFTSKRKVGLAVAASGVVVAGVAIGFGVSANSLRSDALATCTPTACTEEQAGNAQAKNDRARSRATYANLGFIFGGAAVATGVVLWFVGKQEAPSLAIAPHLGDRIGLALTGSF